MLAAGKGQLSLLRRLIEAKANVNAQDSDGWTALHLAAGGGDAALAGRGSAVGAVARRAHRRRALAPRGTAGGVRGGGAL